MLVPIFLSLTILAGQTATFEPPLVTPAPKADASKLVCKRETIPNSRFTKKVCRSREAVDMEREQARRFTDDAQRASAICAGNCK
jgi:hypothetical protein